MSLPPVAVLEELLLGAWPSTRDGNRDWVVGEKLWVICETSFLLGIALVPCAIFVKPFIIRDIKLFFFEGCLCNLGWKSGLKVRSLYKASTLVTTLR